VPELAPKPKRKPAWTIVEDNREQRPWQLGLLIAKHDLPFVVEPGTLRSGDYSLREAPHVVIERKSLQDLVGCIGHGRERFQRELARLHAEARHAFVFVEGTVAQVDAHDYRGEVTPSQVLGTLLGWSLTYDAHFVWAGSPDAAAALALRLFGIVRARMLKQELEAG
jgi:DNA excision repair protein ERCC-4